MIPLSQPSQQYSNWQQELAEAISSPFQLLSLLQLDPAEIAISHTAASTFRMRVPHNFIMRMRPGDKQDPLLRQVLPIDDECNIQPGYSEDPLNESAAMPVPGLLHKYHGRALLTVTGACAIHCRYCFRRHFPYTEANPAQDHWHKALDYLKSHPEITEIILSGGDPLSLTDHKLAKLITELEAITHLQRLRIHTRLPVVLPNRVTPELINCLSKIRLKTVLVLHFNHANEINGPVISSIKELSASGSTLLNQSVLLKGVNDSVEALSALSQGLFAAGVLPYYLHQLDPVQGTAHFAVSDTRAANLIGQLRTQLPGYLMPRLVRELASAPAKSPLGEF